MLNANKTHGRFAKLRMRACILYDATSNVYFIFTKFTPIANTNTAVTYADKLRTYVYYVNIVALVTDASRYILYIYLFFVKSASNTEHVHVEAELYIHYALYLFT